MPLNTPASVTYNFERSYDTLKPIVVPIKIKNTSFFEEDVQSLSAFSAAIDKLVFYPEFDVEYEGLRASPHADSYRYFFDLGDGTISDELTAKHGYLDAGNYKITLVVADSANNFYVSTHRPVVEVINPIEDGLYLTYKNAQSAVSSSFDNPIIITRYNSYQSWAGVSANGGYTVNLAVSGNRQPFMNEEEFYKDPYAHLKSFSAFASATNKGYEILTSVKTSNTFIYANRKVLTPSVGLDFSYEPFPGSVFVGTSGQAEVYYYED